MEGEAAPGGKGKKGAEIISFMAFEKRKMGRPRSAPAGIKKEEKKGLISSGE